MCGITGIWWRQPPDPDSARHRLQGMRDALRHRGPDDAGLWLEGAVGFGHRRLSIVDLSPLGHQPMASADQRYVMCFNGEVFNHAALRNELAQRGHPFRGGSDTEVMLAAIVEWGLVAAVRQFIGMFAFSLWDRHEQRLHLVRDRVGVKPLYVARTVEGDVVFGSELKALAAHPGFSRRVSPEALDAYLRYAYVPAPLTLFADAIKLLPGHILTLANTRDPFDPRAYWSLEEVAQHGAAEQLGTDEPVIVDQLESLLREAVQLRMLADVPLGAFLSGGIDSSLVVALMQAQATRPVKTFTIGFAEARFDESAHARAVATRLGTDHTEQVVTAAEAQAVIPELPTMYDEPLADASQIPTFLVSALARSRVTVALSGDGGDELFGGYARYAVAPRVWAKLRPVPASVRRVAGSTLTAAGVLPIPSSLRRRLRRAGALVGAEGFAEVYRQLVSTRPDTAALVLRTPVPRDRLLQLMSVLSHRAEHERMMFVDTAIYLPDDLLTKLDRASMAVGLEGRVPLLDHRVVEFAWRLPWTRRQGKRLLRTLLGRYLPRELYERPKMGFEVPIGPWLRGPLRAWAEDLLDTDTVRRGGVFSAPQVGQAWRKHLDGSADSPHLIWAILMFEAWQRHWQAHV